MLVTLEPSDTYDVRLVNLTAPIEDQVIEHRQDVYCDDLQHAVERVYDKAIESRNEGFIPIG
jgi:hypothetical protein